MRPAQFETSAFETWREQRNELTTVSCLYISSVLASHKTEIMIKEEIIYVRWKQLCYPCGASKWLYCLFVVELTLSSEFQIHVYLTVASYGSNLFFIYEWQLLKVKQIQRAFSFILRALPIQDTARNRDLRRRVRGSRQTDFYKT